MWRAVLFSIIIVAAADWFLFDSYYLDGLARMARDISRWFGF